MPILCLNSHVAFGYVGNDAAAFCLRRLGVEAWQVDTVVYSNHPGYGAYCGRVVPAADLRGLLEGVGRRGVLGDCEGVLSGYLGAVEQGQEVLRAIESVRAANAGVLVVVDPVMGDTGPGLYVAPEVARFLSEAAVARADVVTPNAFELGHLVGAQVHDRAGALAAARQLLARGPRLVLVTSLPRGASAMEMLAVTPEDAWSLEVPKLTFTVPPNGAGDALAGLFAGHLLRGERVPEALAGSANAVHAVLEATRAAGRRELALIAAQDVLADPPRRFRPVRL